MAFSGSYDGGLGHGVFIGDGGSLTTIVKRGDPAGDGVYSASRDVVVSGDKAAFFAFAGPRGFGVYVGSGGPLTRIAAIGDSADGGRVGEVTHISIGGEFVAFDGRIDPPQGRSKRALFVGSGGPLTTVIKTGDPLFGSTLSFLEFSRHGMDANGSGNLAFTFALENGLSGVAMAVRVSEPATSWVLLIGLGLVGLRQCSRHALSCRNRVRVGDAFREGARHAECVRHGRSATCYVDSRLAPSLSISYNRGGEIHRGRNAQDV